MEKEGRYKEKITGDFHNLGYAQIADNYLKQGGNQGVALAQKCLEKILIENNVSDPWIISTVKNPKIIKETIDSQLNDYNECKGEETIGELIKYHSGTLNDYSKGVSERILNEFNGLLNVRYKDIEEKIKLANYKIQGEKLGQTTKKDAEQAKKELEIYEKLGATISIAENSRLKGFEMGVEGSLNKEAFNQFYPAGETKKAA